MCCFDRIRKVCINRDLFRGLDLIHAIHISVMTCTILQTMCLRKNLFFFYVVYTTPFCRYYGLLKRSFRCVWRTPSESSNEKELFGLAADLSMLRLMETFLESVPQLLLQTYIMLWHQRTSKIQCESLVYV